MNHKLLHSLAMWMLVMVLLTALLACNLTTTATPSPVVVSGETMLPPTASSVPPVSTFSPVPSVITDTPTSVPIVHTMIPGDPSNNVESDITDRDSSAFATQHRANGGENYTLNLYERPFNANTMDTYFPDLDITHTRLSRDSNWVYVIIHLTGQNQSGGLQEIYGVELDLNVDGRGDVLVMAANPGAKWSTEGVRAWTDNNHDVGSSHPIQSDAPTSGDGYETLVFDNGSGTDPDAAWARVSPTDQNSVQIAFKRSLITDDDHFTWGAWAISASMFNQAWFDYNDHFTAAEAGSPLIEQTQYYPIKAFAEVDNTCRWAVGFTPIGNEPGICPVPPTPTPILPGSISGIVFHQINGDLIYHPGDIIIPGATIRVRSGDCSSPGGVVTTGTTNAAGKYTVSVNPGKYCVDVSPDPIVYNNKTPPQTVTVGSGAAVNNVNFGYSEYLGMR